ncbi:MAG: hypothetical protein G01um101424_124 [Parcubacteria group bacterium Gr01-1014_24]|nr:MAG: hypothetical protein G01um101424_124 [Parcubacteria group bacterium Gr01-1014_24]
MDQPPETITERLKREREKLLAKRARAKKPTTGENAAPEIKTPAQRILSQEEIDALLFSAIKKTPLAAETPKVVKTVEPMRPLETRPPAEVMPTGETSEADARYEEAKRLVGADPISVSFLQRNFRIGFSEAARLKDRLEDERAGHVPPPVAPVEPAPTFKIPPEWTKPTMPPGEATPPLESNPDLRGSFYFIENSQRRQAEILEGRNPYGLVFRGLEADVRREIEGLSSVVSLPKDRELLNLLRGSQDRLSRAAELTIPAETLAPAPSRPPVERMEDKKAQAIARLRETIGRNEEIIASAHRELREIEVRLDRKRKNEVEIEIGKLEEKQKRIGRFVGKGKGEVWWKRGLNIIILEGLVFGTLGGYLVYVVVKDRRITKRLKELDREEIILRKKILEAERLERERLNEENY